MKYLYTFICVSFMLFACSTDKTLVFLESKAAVNSVKNRNYAREYDNGFKKGYDLGYTEGYQKGFADAQKKYYVQGIHDGYIQAIEAARQRKEDIMPDRVAQGYFEKYQERCGAGGALSTFDCMMEKIKGYYIDKQFDTIPPYKHGFYAGWRKAFDSIYAPLHVMERQIVYPNPMGSEKLLIDYDSSVVLKVREISLNTHPSRNLTTFASALCEVNKGILRYVAYRLNLSATEEREMYAEYNKMHSKHAAICFNSFKRIIESENINVQSKGFYNFNLYHNTNVFMEVVSSQACSMVDLILTYVKKNALYSSVWGLNYMGEGHICQIIIEEVLRKFRIHTERLALGYDYQIARPEIEVSLRQSLANVVVESRVVEYPKPFEAKVKATDGSDVTIKMQLYAFVGLGLQREVIELGHTLSGNSSNLIVKISDVPYLMPQFFHVGYKILNTDVTIEYTTAVNKTSTQYSIWNLPAGGVATAKSESIQTKKVVTIDAFEKVFEANKYRVSYENVAAHLKTTKLNQACVQQFNSIVVKVLEPALSLPNSRYKAFLNFGSSNSLILNTID